MHNGWLKMQRAARGLLAAALIASSVLAPLAVAPQTAQAQTSAGKMVVAGASGATLYDAPQGEKIASLPLGSVLMATERSADGKWIVVRTDGGDTGWVQMAEVVAFGLNSLPVAGDAAGAGTAEAAPAATVAPAATATKVAPTATTAATATPTAAATATPTAEPSPTPLPTATALPPTPTAAATATPAPAAAPANSAGQTARSLIAVVGGTGAELYDMPGGAKVQDLPIAVTLTAALRNATGDWVFVTTNDGASGWTPAANLVAFGLDRLPVLDVSAGDGATAETSESAAATTAGDAASSQEAAATESAATESATTESAAMAAPAAGVPATVTITEQRLNIRSGPGAEYRIIEKAQPGAVLTATARTADSAWVRIWRDDLPDGGWVSAQFLAVDDLAALPVDESVAETEAEAEAPAAEPAQPAAMPTATPVPAANAAQTEAAAPAGESAAATTEPVAAVAAPAQSVPAAQPAGLEGTLVFQDGRNNIYVYELATGNVRWLTNGYDPDITLDGQRVTFVRGGGDVNGVWTINIDGSGERQIHGGGEIMRGPKWSPDGNWIVFSRNNTNWHCFNAEYLGCVSIFELMGRITLGPIPLPPPGPGVPTKDEIKRSIIDRILNGAERLELPNWIITRINADGGDFRDINALDSAVSPDWNAAGIVYQAKPGLEITQDTPDGRTKALIQEGWDWDPDWEPNGGRIVYQSKEGSHWEIFSISPEGGAPFALTRPETTLVDQLPSNVAPAFSPDGQHIVYLSNRDENEDAGPWRLWVMDNGGGNKRPLPIDITLDYGFSSEQVASWGK